VLRLRHGVAAGAAELEVLGHARTALRTRQQVERRLALVRERAARAGISSVFVAVADEDLHAMDFYRGVGGAESAVTMFSFDTG
jgi:hypothetical protein